MNGSGAVYPIENHRKELHCGTHQGAHLKKSKASHAKGPLSSEIYDHTVYDSTKERDFAGTNTDWAIAFYEGTVKQICFVAETTCPPCSSDS